MTFSHLFIIYYEKQDKQQWTTSYLIREEKIQRETFLENLEKMFPQYYVHSDD